MTLHSDNMPASWRERALSVDRVVIAILAILGVTYLISPDQGSATLGLTLTSLWQTAPFLLLSILIAAYAGASEADNLIARAFSGRTTTMVFTAALFGALSPFCSCGVIPIIAALLAMGVPLAPVMAFWLASPVMDPSMFALTTSVLGLDFAIAKTVAAIGLGLFGGFGIIVLGRLGIFADPLREGVGNGGCSASIVRQQNPVIWAFWKHRERIDTFRKLALKNLFFLGKWLTLAFVLESLMLAYVPAEWVSSLLAGPGIAPIAIATVVGVPTYLNGYAALPLVSGLLNQGMAPGAGLSFMVAGGVTCIPAAVAVFALVKRAVFMSYVGFALTGSLVAGIVFQMLSVSS